MTVARAVPEKSKSVLTPQQQADFDAPASGKSRSLEAYLEDTTSLSVAATEI